MTSATSRPARRLPPSPLRRTSEAMLTLGTVVAAAAAFGPLWAVRLGLVVALGSAGAACAYAWTELRRERRAHAAAMLASTRAHGQALSEERRQHASTLAALTARVRTAASEAARQAGLVDALRQELATVRGERAQLREELRTREVLLTGLRATLRAREAELADARQAEPPQRNGGEEAEVHTMPRRRAAGPVPASIEIASSAAGAQVPGAGVVDLTSAAPVVLPNCEVDRRFA